MRFLNNKRNIWFIVAVLAVIAIAIGFIPSGDGEHGHVFWWSHIQVFFAIFGFLGCMVLGLFAKKIVNYWIDRKEDYYD